MPGPTSQLDADPSLRDALQMQLTWRIKRRKRGLSELTWNAIHRNLVGMGMTLGRRQMRRFAEERWPTLYAEACL